MISINIFKHNRPFLPLSIYSMNQMSKHSKEQVKVNVLTSRPVGKFDFEIDPALTVNIIPFAPGNNYGARWSTCVLMMPTMLLKLMKTVS